MNVRTLAASAALAAAGTALVAVPALADGAAVARSAALVSYGLPEGAAARVHSTSTPAGRTVVTLTVTGLQPGRTYGAHAHVAPCGSTGAAAGGHWQREPGAATPDNEIWLDVTTNAAGNGTSRAVQDFAFSPASRPRSVILHADPTAPGGAAGARLACLTVDF